MSSPAIVARGVTKYFGDFPALRDISLEVPKGSVLALLGRNGAGKTTMLRILAGLTSPTSGSVSFPSSGARQRNGAGIGVIGHGTWLYDDLTTEENLQFYCHLYGVPNPDRAVARWLARVGLSGFRNTRVSDCSRGMRQRLTIARAFLHGPEVLLLDEPWTALDDRAAAMLAELLGETKNAGHVAVICSHQLREATALADCAALLDRGSLVFHGPVDAGLRANPRTLYDRIR